MKLNDVERNLLVVTMILICVCCVLWLLGGSCLAGYTAGNVNSSLQAKNNFQRLLDSIDKDEVLQFVQNREKDSKEPDQIPETPV